MRTKTIAETMTATTHKITIAAIAPPDRPEDPFL
jgi:hypothetical protein